MNNIIARVIKQPKRYWAKFLLNFSSLMSDKCFMKTFYMYTFGKPLNLENPRTFCEKLQWLKLNDRNPIYTKMVDKYEVKKYVAEKIGSEYIIPTLGVWNHPNEIEWESLPDQFVLKTTHGGGGNGVIICRDKNTLDKKKVEMQLQKSLDADLYKQFREWPYKNVRKRIIAERLLKPRNNQDLKDYKFFCFNGKVEFFKIDFGRFIEHHANYYSISGNLLPFGELTCPPDITHYEEIPDNIDKMIGLAEVLSKGKRFMRVDFYNISGVVYFGEITFYPAAGFGAFVPNEWNTKIGQLLKF